MSDSKPIGGIACGRCGLPTCLCECSSRPRRHFVSPPHRESPTWDLYAEPEWMKALAHPSSSLVAACTSPEAAEAAARLLCS